MGGRAFLQVLPSHAFPRLPTSLYQSIKSRLTPKLQQLFRVVQVPAEAPEKFDHGDVDFLVAGQVVNPDGVTPEEVKEVLGARYMNGLPGYKPSNYAVPLDDDELREYYAHARDQPSGMHDSTLLNRGEAVYCQVDVQVCATELEVQNIIMMHGYGDLGIILAAIAAGNGLSLSVKGLKVKTPHPEPPIILDCSIASIFNFLGLSMDVWRAGFATRLAVFEFAASSRFFDPRKMDESHSSSLTKAQETRIMYSEFLSWARRQHIPRTLPRDNESVVEEALDYFGKRKEWDDMGKERNHRRWAKETFNGNVVAEWTGLGWRGVKEVMSEMRRQAGGEEMLVGKEIGEIKALVLSTQAGLGLKR